MRAAVASAGGSTEAGLEALAAHGAEAAFAAAVEASLAQDEGPMSLALTRNDIADYVGALFFVYIILIFVRILISCLPPVPHSATLRAVLGFVTDTTDPYLNLFRRFLPPIGGGGFRSTSAR